MIGVIKEDRVFQFNHDQDLIYSLGAYAKRYSVNTIIITTRIGVIKGVVRNDDCDFKIELEAESQYRVIGLNTTRADEFSKNDKIEIDPKDNPKIQFNQSFWFVNQRIPKELSL